jgi:hypothetical protein
MTRFLVEWNVAWRETTAGRGWSAAADFSTRSRRVLKEIVGGGTL